MVAERDGAVVSGVGLRAALGEHAVQVAASVRAGLSGLREWPDFETPQGPLVAATVEPLLLDRPWPEKVLDLLERPLAEALAQAQVADLDELAQGRRVRAFVSVPYLDRAGADAEAVAALRETLVEDLFHGLEAPVPLELVGFDHAGGAVVLARACDALQRGDADLCLVLGADSWLEGPVLDALLEAGRLKVPRGRGGFIPGEGGAALVVEGAASARRRGAAMLAHVAAVAVDREAPPWSPEAPASGRALGRAIDAATGAAGGLGGISRVLLDLSGERWRFLEWTLVEARLSDRMPRGWRMWHPADGLGDVGAAFVPMAVGLAARAFARGYAGRGQVLIGASSERGERGAVVLAPGKEG